jgi:hypothetical protein
VRNTPAPDQWTLDTAHFGRATTPAFSYRVFSESPSAAASPTSPAFAAAPDAPPSPLARFVPLVLRPVWKPDGDKIGLLLQYGPNPACALATPATLRNVVLVATYLGGKGARAQTRPGGTHLGDKGVVYWRLGDVVLDPASGAGEGKVVCRVFGADAAAVLRPGHVEARWEHVPEGGSGGDGGSSSGSSSGGAAALASGISISRLVGRGGEEGEEDRHHDEAEQDPFADDDAAAARSSKDVKTWVDVPLARKLVSGKYEVRAPGAGIERGFSGGAGAGGLVPRTPVVGSPTSVPIPGSP